MPNSYDDLTDEEFESLLSDINEGKLDDDLNSEDNGEIDDNDSKIDNNEDDISEVDNTDDNDIEDTDSDQSSNNTDSDELDTNDEDDDSQQDISDEELDVEDDNQEENTQNDDDIEDVDDKEDQDKESSDEISYKEEYQKLSAETEKYKDFYNKVTGEFVANGKVMKGFTEPEKIIQAQQMAAGFSEKMRAFKQYRPFIEPLKKKGILDNPDKFNLMIDAIDGNQEAIKALLKETNIDPLELNIDEVDYKPGDNLASPIALAYDDLIDTASQFGIDDRVNNIITKEWDEDSVAELLSDPKNSSDLIAHMNNGVYDMVQERIAKKKMTDITGSFGSMKAIDQYRATINELEQEYVQQQQMQQQQAVQKQEPASQFSEEAIQAEIARIKAEKEQALKREKANNKANTARKKAASVSKKKSTIKQAKKVFDPMELSDDEFEKYVLSLQYKE